MSTSQSPAEYPWDIRLLDGWEHDVSIPHAPAQCWDNPHIGDLDGDMPMFAYPTFEAPIEPEREPFGDDQAQATEPLSSEQYLRNCLEKCLGYPCPALDLESSPMSQYGPVDPTLAPADGTIDPRFLEKSGYVPPYQTTPEIDIVDGSYCAQDVVKLLGMDIDNEYNNIGQELEAATAMPVRQAVDTPALQPMDPLAPITHMSSPPVQVAADSTDITPTCTGILMTAHDARSVIKCCLAGALPLVTGRLKKEARASLIRDGNIFCFREAKPLARWTDGVTWSPNREIPDFSLYREINNKPGEEKFVKPKDSRAALEAEDPLYVGVLTGDCFDFRPNGLMKKVFKAKVGEDDYKVVSYYRPHTAKKLLPPFPDNFSEDELAGIRSVGGKFKETMTKNNKANPAKRKQGTKLRPEQLKKVEELKANSDKKELEDFLRKTTNGAISKNPKRRGLVPYGRALSQEKFCVLDCGGVIKQDGSCRRCGRPQ